MQNSRKNVCERFESVDFSVLVFLDKCSQCGKKYGERFHLNEHIRAKHMDVAYICYIPSCRARFVKKSDLTRHINGMHLGVSRCKCRFCDKKFSRADSLARHIKGQHSLEMESEDSEEM